MPFFSRQTVIYTPDGHEPLTLCNYDDIMEELPTREPSVTIQRDAVYRRDWLKQSARGNAAIILTFTTALAFGTRAEAEAFSEDRIDQLLLNPMGMLTIMSGYTDNGPGRTTEYIATVDKVTPFPITSDHYYSNEAAWLAIAYQFTLTK